MSAEAPESTLRPGQVLGRYTVMGPLGKGGMGEVYRARDNRLDRVVALKLLPVRVVNDREQLLRFQNEARTLAALNHPGIVTLHAVEEEGAYHFLIMEFVEGHTLRDAIHEGGMDLKDFFDIALTLSEALAAAHEEGVIHRDLKPENVMFTRTGRLKVLDFGLARFEAPAGSEPGLDSPTAPLTKEGFIVGTVPYLSPEQIQGRTADSRSDIFSLGIVLFEMLAGQRPFRGDSAVGIMSSILRDEPAPLEDVRNDLPPQLGRILRRCLEKRPEDRIPTVHELRVQLRDLRSELTEARVISASSRPSAFSASTQPVPLGPDSLIGAFRRHAPLHGILAAVMTVNFVETASETWLRDNFGLGVQLGDKLAEAAHGIENGLSFDSHDVTNTVAVHGFALAYFVLFPLMALGLAWTLARRADSAYRVLVYAVGGVYAISLPFFLFFPVPERWFYPESGAILLSDLWTSRFIEAFRPISGIDNCFPSFHTSLVTIVVLAGFRYGLKHRYALAMLGLVVILSTFVLGIHWIPDIVAGVAAGILAFSLASRYVDRSSRSPATASTQDLEGLEKTGPTARIPSRSTGATGGAIPR